MQQIFRRFAISLTAIFLATALPARSAETLKIADGQKVAFLGDSITALGYERPGGYVRLVAAGLASVGVKIVVIPAGVSGNTSQDMLARLGPAVIEKKPDWMTLSCGVNDVRHGKKGVELEPYKENITAIVDQAQKAGIKILLLTATVTGEEDNANNQKLAAYNDFLRQFAREKGLPLADLNAAFARVLKASPAPVAASSRLLTVDGVHMNAEGNWVMARGVLQAFGVSPSALASFETAWRRSDDATAAYADLTLRGTAAISFHTLEALNAAAAAQKISAAELQNQLYFNALRTVLKAREQDSAFTLAQIQPELDRAFREQLKAVTAPSKAGEK